VRPEKRVKVREKIKNPSTRCIYTGKRISRKGVEHGGDKAADMYAVKGGRWERVRSKGINDIGGLL
jgi:hypothetical protein